MERPPRPADEPILTFPLIMRTLLVGILLLIGAYGLYLYEMNQGASMEYARTVTTTVFVVLESAYLLNCRSLVKPLSAVGYFTNLWVYAGIGLMLVFQLALVYVPLMNNLFQTEPLSLMSWMRILAAGLGVYIIVSFEKMLRRRRGDKG
jgi:Ca2+-transporting ATPase